MDPAHSIPPLPIPKEYLTGWQSATNLLVELVGVPISLVTRVRGRNLEIMVSSGSEVNPFVAGQEVPLLGSGSYCEEVLRLRGGLSVGDARRNERWNGSREVEEGRVAFLGFPLLLPGGRIFGTISVSDLRPRVFSSRQERLLLRFRDLVDSQLALAVLAREQRERRRLLETYRDELKQLREVFPICPSCKRVRNDPEYWDAVEEYLVSHVMGEFGHGLCPDCARELWDDTLLTPEPVPLPRGLGSGVPAKA